MQCYGKVIIKTTCLHGGEFVGIDRATVIDNKSHVDFIVAQSFGRNGWKNKVSKFLTNISFILAPVYFNIRI